MAVLGGLLFWWFANSEFQEEVSTAAKISSNYCTASSSSISSTSTLGSGPGEPGVSKGALVTTHQKNFVGNMFNFRYLVLT